MPIILLIFFLFPFSNFRAEELTFDVKQHLSTVTRYDASKCGRNSNHSVPPPPPPPADGCVPIHLNLVARHGTRAPTQKRIEELNNLENELKKLLGDDVGIIDSSDLHKVPSWLKKWKSPWSEKVNGGELIPEGEEELYNLGIRTKKLFPHLLSDNYHPDLYSIKATQIDRASASAVAFGMGLFNGSGSLGSDRHRAFSVISENRASDVMLRFFESCQRYKKYKKKQKPKVEKLKEPVLHDITKSLTERYGLNFTQQHVSSLWFLCKQEASLLNKTDQACGLFNPSEVALLEWTDDIEVFMLKGYGNSLNYRMGIHLLEDVFESMKNAIKTKQVEKQVPGRLYQKAKLRFSHAETVIPFTCLLGLFREGEGQGFKPIQKEHPLELPPRPPATRNWKVSNVSPFAGNIMLVLYSCPVADSSDEYFVRVLHNEEPISMPGCDGSYFCPFNMFKDKIVDPLLKHDFKKLCTVNEEEPTQVLESSKLSLFDWLSKLSLFDSFFWLRNGDKQPQKDEL